MGNQVRQDTESGHEMIKHPDRDILIQSMKKLAGCRRPDLFPLDPGRPGPLRDQPKREQENKKRHSEIVFVNPSYDSRKTGIGELIHLPSAYRVYIGSEFLSFTCSQLKSLSHEHFAIQLAFNFEAPFQLSIDGSEEREFFFFIIPAHVPHRLVSSAGKHLSILIDPLSVLGRKLNVLFDDQRSFMSFNRAVLGRIYPDLYTLLAGFETVHFLSTAVARIDHLISELPESSLDERIQDAIARCKINGGKNLGTRDLAGWTSLSESRARHLFKEETGVPFTQYLKWLKVMAAVKHACATGSSLTETAHMAGFSDSAHLSRTFKAMFGLAPSSVLQ